MLVKYETSSLYKMREFVLFIMAVCDLFLFKRLTFINNGLVSLVFACLTRYNATVFFTFENLSNPG